MIGLLLVIGAALPALALTLIRLLDLGSGPAIRLQAFQPFAIPLLALLLVVGVVATWRRWGAAVLRWPVRALTVLAAVGLGLHLWWFAPMIAGDRPAADPDAEPLVVVGSNIEVGAGDSAGVLRRAVALQADVLVITEITLGALERMEDAGLTRAFPYSAGRADPEVSGTMLFANEPVQLVEDLDTSFLSFVADVGDPADAGAEPVRVMAVHPRAPVLPEGWRADHEVIREAADRNRPDVVVGDFNATMDHEPMRRLRSDGYRDSAELLNRFEPSWPHQGFPLLDVLPASVPIDHVLVAPGWTATDTGTFVVDDTDHLAVHATVVPAT